MSTVNRFKMSTWGDFVLRAINGHSFSSFHCTWNAIDGKYKAISEDSFGSLWFHFYGVLLLCKYLRGSKVVTEFSVPYRTGCKQSRLGRSGDDGA
jgi:hypothetical protein